jgi:hypothetical protein
MVEIMKYDYAGIIKELKSINGTEKKQRYIQKIVRDIKQSVEAEFTEIPPSRFEHLKKRIQYMENIFILRNILIESYLDEAP